MRDYEVRHGTPKFYPSHHAVQRLMKRFPGLADDYKMAVVILERLAERGLRLSRADASKLIEDGYVFNANPTFVIFSPELEAMLPVARHGLTSDYTILTVFRVKIAPEWRELVDSLKYEPAEN